jgi:hypothetical protein
MLENFAVVLPRQANQIAFTKVPSAQALAFVFPEEALGLQELSTTQVCPKGRVLRGGKCYDPRCPHFKGLMNLAADFPEEALGLQELAVTAADCAKLGLGWSNSNSKCVPKKKLMNLAADFPEEALGLQELALSEAAKACLLKKGTWTMGGH